MAQLPDLLVDPLDAASEVLAPVRAPLGRVAVTLDDVEAGVVEPGRDAVGPRLRRRQRRQRRQQQRQRQR